MNATKQRFGEDDLDELFEGGSKMIVAKGKKVTELSLKTAEAEEVSKLALGPTGNLRAPTAKVGKTWLIGFNEEAYEQVFG